MPNILMAYPIDYTSLILADKLRGDVDNHVTLYLDPDMRNAFSTNAVHDLQSMSSENVEYTSSMVISLKKKIEMKNMICLGLESIRLRSIL